MKHRWSKKIEETKVEIKTELSQQSNYETFGNETKVKLKEIEEQSEVEIKTV